MKYKLQTRNCWVLVTANFPSWVASSTAITVKVKALSDSNLPSEPFRRKTSCFSLSISDGKKRSPTPTYSPTRNASSKTSANRWWAWPQKYPSLSLNQPPPLTFKATLKSTKLKSKRLTLASKNYSLSWGLRKFNTRANCATRTWLSESSRANWRL